jgi:hypothetical protein
VWKSVYQTEYAAGIGETRRAHKAKVRKHHGKRPYKNTVACPLKAGIPESERQSIARQRPGSHVSCTIEVTFPWHRQGKRLFSQQQKELFYDNGGINSSIRCSLVGKPSSYERERVREQTQRWEESSEDQRCKTRGIRHPHVAEYVNYCNRVYMC